MTSLENCILKLKTPLCTLPSPPPFKRRRLPNTTAGDTHPTTSSNFSLNNSRDTPGFLVPLPTPVAPEAEETMFCTATATNYPSHVKCQSEATEPELEPGKLDDSSFQVTKRKSAPTTNPAPFTEQPPLPVYPLSNPSISPKPPSHDLEETGNLPPSEEPDSVFHPAKGCFPPTRLPPCAAPVRLPPPCVVDKHTQGETPAPIDAQLQSVLYLAFDSTTFAEIPQDSAPMFTPASATGTQGQAGPSNTTTLDPVSAAGGSPVNGCALYKSPKDSDAASK